MTAAPRGTAEAVVLRTVAFGEADLVVTLLSREHGKLSAVARAARKSQRRFGGALGTLVIGRAELASRPRAELWSLRSFELVRDFRALAADVVALAHASYGIELVRELLPAEQPEPAAFALLVELFEVLLAQGPAPAVLRAFELALLGINGLAPVLDRCVVCGDRDPAALDGPGAGFDAARGGLVCARCRRDASLGAGAARAFSAEARAELVRAQGAPGLAAAHPGRGARGSPAAVEARDAMLAVVLHHIGKPLRSIEFLVKLAAGARGP